MAAQAESGQGRRERCERPWVIDRNASRIHRPQHESDRVNDSAHSGVGVACTVVHDGVSHRATVRAECDPAELEPGRSSSPGSGRAVFPELNACGQRLGIFQRHGDGGGAACGLIGKFTIGHGLACRCRMRQAGKPAGRCQSARATAAAEGGLGSARHTRHRTGDLC